MEITALIYREYFVKKKKHFNPTNENYKVWSKCCFSILHEKEWKTKVVKSHFFFLSLLEEFFKYFLTCWGTSLYTID